MILDCNGKPVQVEPIPATTQRDSYQERDDAFLRLKQSWPEYFRREYFAELGRIRAERAAEAE